MTTPRIHAAGSAGKLTGVQSDGSDTISDSTLDPTHLSPVLDGLWVTELSTGSRPSQPVSKDNEQQETTSGSPERCDATIAVALVGTTGGTVREFPEASE